MQCFLFLVPFPSQSYALGLCFRGVSIYIFLINICKNLHCCSIFVCFIRDGDFHYDLYRLPAIICVRKFFFHFVFLSTKSAL